MESFSEHYETLIVGLSPLRGLPSAVALGPLLLLLLLSMLRRRAVVLAMKDDSDDEGTIECRVNNWISLHVRPRYPQRIMTCNRLILEIHSLKLSEISHSKTVTDR